MIDGMKLKLLFLCVVLSAPGFADETERSVEFAPPVRIKAGDKFIGEGRLFPSPVLHDINGDKRLDIVIGDLFGRVTIAMRTPQGVAVEAPLKNRDGQDLKFKNW